MDNRPGGYATGERERVPGSKAKFTQKWEKLGSFLLFSTKPPPHQDPSQSGGPRGPDNHQIPGLAELPDNPSGPNYPAAHVRKDTDMAPLPPAVPAGHYQYPPRAPGQQASTMPPEVTPGTEIIIALMGVTGAGKSYFIKEVTGNPDVRVSSGLYSCTGGVQAYSFEYVGAKITLVDTPGFNDTERSDTEVLKEIADWTSETYRKDQLLSGIIYLHPITHTRVEGSAMRNLRMFQNLCGEKAMENVLLTTTQWSNVDPAEGQAREDELQEDGLWGELIRKGATLQRFHGTRESGFELIHKLMSNTEKPLDIQDQIVEQNMTLLETNAGQCINEELIAQEKKFKKQLDSLEKKLQEVMGAMGREMENLMEEQAKTRQKLREAEAEMKLLAGLHAAEVKRRKAKEREEKARTCKRAAIAITAEDISITPDIRGVLTSRKTRGRLILDIGDWNFEEFEQDTFEITIDYKLSLLDGIRAITNPSKQEFNPRIGEISFHGVHYRCKSGGSIPVAGQEFVIFNRVSSG